MLARGGMAVVYLAVQPTLDRQVALKRLQLETTDPTLAQRFVREAKLAAGLDHPNVVTLFDFFEDGGVPYIAMEYVSGGSLRRLVGHLTLPQVFGVLEGVLAGLAHAETRGIAHRDLKPENVLITRDGRREDRRLRHRARVQRADAVAHQDGLGDRHAVVHGARAGDRRSARALHRSLRARRHRLRVVVRASAVQHRHAAGRGPLPPRPHAAAAARRAGAGRRRSRSASGSSGCSRRRRKSARRRPQPRRRRSRRSPSRRSARTGAAARRSDRTPRPSRRWPPRSSSTAAPETPTTRVVSPAGAAACAAGRRPRVVAAAGAAAAVLADRGRGTAGGPERPGSGARRPAARRPYDFDGDGRRELVLGMPGSGPRAPAWCLVRSGKRGRTVLTADDAGLQAAVQRRRGVRHAASRAATSTATG